MALKTRTQVTKSLKQECQWPSAKMFKNMFCLTFALRFETTTTTTYLRFILQQLKIIMSNESLID